MKFNSHFDLEGKHAFLSASNYHWINYDDNKLEARFFTWKAAQRGTALHEFAKQAIQLGIKLPRNNKTLNSYVNDGIGFRMQVEQPLYFSENCFGTADTISFKRGILRIHDLKTGSNPASMKQLCVYTSLFCLEYDEKPRSIDIELRIYQNDEVDIQTPDADYIEHIMERIQSFDRRIKELKAEEME